MYITCVHAGWDYQNRELFLHVRNNDNNAASCKAVFVFQISSEEKERMEQHIGYTQRPSLSLRAISLPEHGTWGENVSERACTPMCTVF